MKKIIVGACLFLSGSIIFSFCLLYTAFEGCVPSEIQGERFLAIVLLITGGCLMGYDLLKGREDKEDF